MPAIHIKETVTINTAGAASEEEVQDGVRAGILVPVNMAVRHLALLGKTGQHNLQYQRPKGAR